MPSPRPPSVNAHDVYEKAEEYWSRVSQDEEGMLGGFAKLHTPDIAISRTFINSLKSRKLLHSLDTALDCGAGIGRVTKHLLMPLFNTVDMVDVIEDLIVKSDEYIGQDDGIGEKFVEGLQTFVPTTAHYDLIWIQWVSGHLTDEDLRDFLRRCVNGLKSDGCIVLKDNVVSTETPLFDSEDHSWTRPETTLLEIFEEAGLQIVSRSIQTGFPKEMYTVKMFALKPAQRETASG